MMIIKVQLPSRESYLPTKHIDIRYPCFREEVQRECIKVSYFQTDLMIVDCLTKHVVKNKLEFCNNALLDSKNVKSNG